MAEWLYTSIVGAKSVAPTTLQLEAIARYDKAAGSAGREGQARSPASFDHVEFPIGKQVPAGGNTQAVEFRAPYPLTMVAIQAGAEVFGAGLSALTVDVLVDGTSVLDAPTDIFAAGAAKSSPFFAPEAASEDVAYDSLVRVVFAATGGTADGATAKILFQRA